MPALTGLAILILMGCGFLTPDPTPTPTPISDPETSPEPDVSEEEQVPLIRTTQELNVRSGASDDCAIIGQYPANTEVPVKAITPARDWWQVEYGAQKEVGWIFAAYTTPVNDVSAVPELPGPSCAPGPAADQPTDEPTDEPTEEPTVEPPPQAAVCGNGVQETGEACDGGGCPQLQQCNASCQCEPLIQPGVCGNGVVEAGEQCDATSCGLAQVCNASCQCQPLIIVQSVCGNGVVEAGEECDQTSCGIAQLCNSSCQCQPFVIQP